MLGGLGSPGRSRSLPDVSSTTPDIHYSIRTAATLLELEQTHCNCNTSSADDLLCRIFQSITMAESQIILSDWWHDISQVP